MAGSKTDVGEAMVLNILRLTTVTAPANWYVALYTTGPSEAGGGGSVEVSGSSYARQICTFAALSGTSPTSTSNNATITFPTVTSTGYTVSGWGIIDAASGAGTLGLVYYFDLSPSVAYAVGDIPFFASGALTVTED